MNFAVVGAGFGGLSAAYDLVKAGHEVTIFETANQVGGLGGGFHETGWDWSVEFFYHHWFASDKHLLTLINELGLKEQVIFPRPLTVMYHNGKFYPFDSIINALLFPGLGFGINKIRFGLVGLYLRLSTDWKSLERYTVQEWMTRWAGEKVYKLMWEPLVIGKFGEEYASQVNMAWMWARLKARTTRLGTFIGGFQRFADSFANRLQERGVAIQLNKPVKKIELVPEGVEITDGSGIKRVFDKVLVTLSPRAMIGLVPQLPETYQHLLSDLKSMGAVVMILALSHQLSKEGYYWYNLPKSAGFPFLALVEHTNFLSPEYFGGDHIVYLGDYLDPSHEYFHLSQNELLERFLPALKKINPDFERTWVRKLWLFRTPYAQPVPLVNQSERLPAIQTPLPGVYFASMSQVYPWDRGSNFAVEIGHRAARIMLGEME